AQRFDGALFADGPRQENERNIRRRLERDVERRQAVERRDREIGKDQVRTEIRERLAEGRLRIDSMVDTADAAALELSPGQLRIGRYVLDNQYSQVQWPPVLRGSTHPRASCPAFQPIALRASLAITIARTRRGGFPLNALGHPVRSRPHRRGALSWSD